MQFQIAPSILAADFLNLGRDVDALNRASSDLLHLDIMDGTFVPNISFGFSVIDGVAKIAQMPMDAHLMVVHPEKWFDRLSKIGVQYLSFHLEAALEEGSDPSAMLRQIKSMGMKAGLAFNPDVPVDKCFPYLEDADFILVMSVYAGFGGQKIVEETVSRIESLKSEIDHRKVNCLIEVDGGVTGDNITELINAGVDIVVTGSSVFKTGDPVAAIHTLREIAEGSR